MTAEEAYNLAQKQIKAGYYTKALEQLNRVRTYYRDDPYALKAELAIADVHFKKNEFDAARLAYEDFMRAHPRYGGLDYVVYRLGQTLIKKAPTVAARDQTWTRQAVNTWLGFANRFPNSEHKDEVEAELRKAQDRLARKELVVARFYARRGAWPAVLGRAAGRRRDRSSGACPRGARATARRGSRQQRRARAFRAPPGRGVARMDERMTVLEEKMAYLERYVSELDGVVRTLFDEMAAVRRELALLRTEAAVRPQAGASSEDDGASITYEVPPHY